jgi:hypothetical protein
MIWEKGDDFKDGDRMTYGIHKDNHGNAIEVYTCEKDRDKILAFLQQDEISEFMMRY